MISEVLNKLDLKIVKLKRNDEDLVISKNVLKSNAMIDEGGYGFEPSLYIFSSESDTVCQIVENIASSMRMMAEFSIFSKLMVACLILFPSLQVVFQMIRVITS